MSGVYKQIMAYTALPKLVPIGNPRVPPEDITKNMITEVLNSEPVKRLLRKPNIIIKAVSIESKSPATTSNSKESSKKVKVTKKINDIEAQLNDDANLLPSKKEGKSEIALIPLKRIRKSCGHFGPCEHIICDVNVQQYADRNGTSPIIARTIDVSEINATVSKHCENPRCDALSIDHNRCRRASVRLTRYDKSNICDICGIALKTRKSRLSHRNCKRIDEYCHNQVDRAQLLRERMRECELQMIEALRMKKTDYSDPVIGAERAIEALKNNSELIVIPKGPSAVQLQSLQQLQQQPIITIKTVSNPTLPMVLSDTLRQNVVINNVTSKIISVDSASNTNTKPVDGGQFIVTTVPQVTPAISYPLSLNDWVVTQSAINPIQQQQKPYLMPVRVVPIANLKSEPSLLHQKQGIPRFCIVADNSVPPQSYVNIQTITNTQPQKQQQQQQQQQPQQKPQQKQQPKQLSTVQKIKPAPSKITEANNKPVETIKLKSRGYYRNRRKKMDKKPFECSYCSKRFLTDWYFKMHVARHKGEIKATCEICEQTFTNNYDLKRHVTNEHKDKDDEKGEKNGEEGDIEMVMIEEQFSVICDNCDQVFESNLEMEEHTCERLRPDIDYDEEDGDGVEEDSEDMIVNGNGACDEEIEKENGIVRGKAVGLTNDKSNNVEQSLKMKKDGKRKRNTHSNTDDDCGLTNNEGSKLKSYRKRKKLDGSPVTIAIPR